MSISLGVECADALQFGADVLALKYAQLPYGLDRVVCERLEEAGEARYNLNPRPDVTSLLPSRGQMTPTSILLLDVEPLHQFGYAQIRAFASKAVRCLAKVAPATEHLALTLHGANYGLYEVEAFEAEVAGLIDAVVGREAPDSLSRILIVERDAKRARRLRESLRVLAPNGMIGADLPTHVQELTDAAGERVRSAGYDSAGRPHVFVAMLFLENMEDTYHFGIHSAVRDAGFICERADTSSFTGDILEWLKDRIRTAEFVIADLTGANPNVYLEVGFAWGTDIHTVLLIHESEDLRFDVRGQRCLIYSSIRDLQQKLSGELHNLRKSQSI